MEIVSAILTNAVKSSNYVTPKKEPQVLFIGVHENGFDVKVTFWSIDAGAADEASSDALALIYQALTQQHLTISTIPKEQRPG